MNRTSSVVERFEDVLEDIESDIVSTSRRLAGISDGDVLFGLDALLARYHDEARQHEHRPAKVSENAEAIASSLREVCEHRLGRNPSFVPERKSKEAFRTVRIEDLIACLRKVRRSVDRWNRRDGVRGYLDFVARFV
jgi:hypothetical protein